MARNSEEPPKTGSTGAARWSDYLDWVRAELVRGVLGLTPEQQRTARVPSGWTPLELLSHVLHMEQRWFVWGFLGEPVDGAVGRLGRRRAVATTASTRRAGRSTTTSPPRSSPTGWRRSAPAPGRCCRRTPSTRWAPPRAGSPTDPPTLEWICFHVLAEYARHAGHLDIVVELAD